jgi:hypothetical protein
MPMLSERLIHLPMLAIAAFTLARPAEALDLPDRCAAAYAAETMRVAERICPFEITMEGLEVIAYANKIFDEACTMAAKRLVAQRRGEFGNGWCMAAQSIFNLPDKPPLLVGRGKK